MVSIMNLELPLFTIASQLNMTYWTNVTDLLYDCEMFYSNELLL
jgi:hypothetical protein